LYTNIYYIFRKTFQGAINEQTSPMKSNKKIVILYRKPSKVTSGLNYPLYFLNFETTGPEVPKYDGSRLYQQLVFKYLLHIQETSTSKLDHQEYL